MSCNNHKSENLIKYEIPPNPESVYLKISTKSKIKDEPKTDATLEIWHKGTHKEHAIGIEYRGALSQTYFNKKSYGFELRDNERSSSLLGLPSAKKWVLHGPYSDKTLIRNALAYDISNQIGRYASRTKFVELEINQQYRGLYVLMDKIEVHKNRVNIKKNASNIIGSFMVKIDKNAGNNGKWDDYSNDNSVKSAFKANRTNIHFLFDYPKAKNIQSSQRDYIFNTMNAFEKALASENYKDPLLGYQNHIDTDSFIDYFLLTELFQNHDGYRISTFITKDVGQKIKMGPIWDFDIAFGSDQGFCHGMNSHAWVYQYNRFCPDDQWLVPFWWEKLLKDPFFKSKLKERYLSLRKSTFSDQNLDKTIDKWSLEITNSGAVERNFNKWDILSQTITPNSTVGPHSREIKRLKTWLKEHAKWIDIKINTI